MDIQSNVIATQSSTRAQMRDQDAKGQSKNTDHWALLALPRSLAITKHQTIDTVAAKPLEVYAALAKQRGLLAP